MNSSSVTIRSARLTAVFVVLLGLLAVSVQGCQDNSPSDPTTRALADPMNYSPHFQNPDVSGVRRPEFGSNSSNQDMDHVLNP
jgi:hypothetical protein